MTVADQPLMPTRYQIQVAQELSAGKKLVSVEIPDDLENEQARATEALMTWINGSLKRSAEELYKWTIDQELENARETLRSMRDPTGDLIKLFLAARTSDMATIKNSISKEMDPFWADEVFDHALHFGQTDVARLLEPHADRYNPPGAVRSALELNFPVESAYCMALLDQLDQDCFVENMHGFFMETSRSGRLDLMSYLHARALASVPFSDETLFDALKITVLDYDHVEAANWLVGVAGAKPERIFEPDTFDTFKHDADRLALRAPFEHRKMFLATLSAEHKALYLPRTTDMTHTQAQAEGRAQRTPGLDRLTANPPKRHRQRP